MSDPHWEKLKEIFHEAVALAPVERAAYLDGACEGNASLRAAIESLLQSHEQSNFIDTPAYEAAAEMVSDDLNIKPGQTIAHYRIISLVGEGGMGQVYLAEDTNLHRRISLKFLNRSFSADSERVRRFQQEARAVSALNQPNILTIYEVGEVDGHRFIATEYIEGRTLREAMISGLDVDAALDIAFQVASALVAAHRVKIIHRDIKPENIMIREEDGVVKVLDFGLAKMSAPPAPVVDSIDREADTRLRANTKPGVVMGTVAYMSPEQARGETVDERTDIWSLGVVLYEMVAGCSPFMAGTSNEIISTILAKTPAAPLSRYAPDVPTRLADIVEKALAKNKDDRYQTSKDLLIDLKRLKQSLDTKAAIERSTSPDKPVVSPAGGSRKPEFVDQAGTSNTQALSSAEYVVGELRRHKRGVVIAVAVLLFATAGIAYGLIELWKRSQVRPATPAQSIKITKLTDSGKTTATAISPDGNYVVYALENEGKQSLWLRQVSPASEREIVPAAAVYIRGLTFSKDGNLIYYTGSERENVFESAALYQVAALGGTPRKVMARLQPDHLLARPETHCLRSRSRG